MATILKVDNLSKKFLLNDKRPDAFTAFLLQKLTGRYEPGREFWALRDVSFSVENGSVLGIIGHNGAGKSTLLRLLSGLGRPTSGRIRWCGKLASLLELGTEFHTELTGRQNLLTGGILAGLRRRQVLEREDEIICFAELEEFIDQPVKTYSEGMFLRLAFATTVLLDPDILIFDEVLSVGDSRFQQKSLAQLQEFRMKGKSIILVSHDLEQVRTICNEALVLEEGRVVMHTDPDTAIKCYHGLLDKRTQKRKEYVLGKAPLPMPTIHSDFEAAGTIVGDNKDYSPLGKPFITK
jgi:lipopolysaccharide transport system ATP-binding protein